MKLHYDLVAAMPRMAWITTVCLQSGLASVKHGPWVETTNLGFVEGVWDAPFAAMDLDRSACIFGSGARVRNNDLVFVPSTSTTDSLFWSFDRGERIVRVANSLPLLLAGLGDELDPTRDYARANDSIMQGICDYVRELPTRRGEVKRLLHMNLVVSRSDAVESDKPLPPGLPTFAVYNAYLVECYARIVANARDGARKNKLQIWSTQSRGYDSTAVNAVAAKFGVDRVFSVAQGKAKGYFASEDAGRETNDDGSEICNVLGLRCTLIDRRSILSNSSREHLYFASMHDVADFNLDQIADYVDRPTVLLTGCLGEMWYQADYYDDRPGLLDGDLRRVDLGNHGMSEVRLHAGFVQFAFPYLGARRRDDVFRITHSNEMNPWRLGTNYDRPIPRRIAEEGGVPREMFGQVKMASALEYPPPLVPHNPDLRRQYFDFLESAGLSTGWKLAFLPLARRWNAVACTVAPDRRLWAYYLVRFLERLRGKPTSLPLFFPRLGSTIFVFCVNRQAQEYARLIAAASQVGAPAADDAVHHGSAVRA